MDLANELKNLGALHTMDQGKYGKAKSFRDSIQDMDTQRKLMDQDKDVRSVDLLSTGHLRGRGRVEGRAQRAGQDHQVRRRPAEDRTPRGGEQGHRGAGRGTTPRTKQFRWRQASGRSSSGSSTRMDRSPARGPSAGDPDDPELKQHYIEFQKERAERRMANSRCGRRTTRPTPRYRYEMAKRLFELGRYDEAIPVFQHVRNDPKYRVEAPALLGRAFLESEFVDEAVDTLKASIEDYQLKGDEKSKDMYYWYARALEQKGDIPRPRSRRTARSPSGTSTTATCRRGSSARSQGGAGRVAAGRKSESKHQIPNKQQGPGKKLAKRLLPVWCFLFFRFEVVWDLVLVIRRFGFPPLNFSCRPAIRSFAGVSLNIAGRDTIRR